MSLRRRGGLPVALLSLGLLFALLAGCAKTVNRRPFDIVYTGYLIGQVNPCRCPRVRLGGLARRATAFHKLEGDTADRVVVDCGSFVSLHPEQGRQRTEVILTALQSLGVRAINIGRRDLRFGIGFLKELGGRRGVPFVSANLRDSVTGTQPFPGHRVLHLGPPGGGGMEVAVIGLAAKLPGQQPPESFGVTLEDPVVSLLEEIERIPREVQYILLLSDADQGTARRWLSALPEDNRLDLVLLGGGRSGNSIRRRVNGALVVTVGRQGRHFDWLRVTPGPEGEWEVERNGYALDPKIPDDPEMVSLLERAFREVGLGPYEEEP